MGWWWSYYFLQLDGDVLIFFDWISMYQVPRTLQEEREFKQALDLMHFLYYAFDVFVIADIPANVQHHGFYLSYLDKGWCWAEASIASLGNKLHRFSEDIVEKLDEEERLRG